MYHIIIFLIYQLSPPTKMVASLVLPFLLIAISPGHIIYSAVFAECLLCISHCSKHFTLFNF